MAEEKLPEEKIVVLNFRKTILKTPVYKRSGNMARLVKKRLEAISKGKQVKIGKSINEEIWKRGSDKPPTKIRIRLIKKDEDTFKAELIRRNQ